MLGGRLSAVGADLTPLGRRGREQQEGAAPRGNFLGHRLALRAQVFFRPDIAQPKGGRQAHLSGLELDHPRPLLQLVAGLTDPLQKEEAYTLAFAIVRADEQVSGAERIYLAQLAAHLGLSPDITRRIEEQTAAGIDAEPLQETHP